jgi:hypothetical protein
MARPITVPDEDSVPVIKELALTLVIPKVVVVILKLLPSR